MACFGDDTIDNYPVGNPDGVPDCADCAKYDVVGVMATNPYVFSRDGRVTYDGTVSWWMDDTLACYYANVYPQYYGYFTACDFDASGVVELDEVYEIYYFATQFGGSNPFAVDCDIY